MALAPTLGLTGLSGLLPQFQIIVFVLPFLALMPGGRGAP
jgi:hypothetical protein